MCVSHIKLTDNHPPKLFPMELWLKMYLNRNQKNLNCTKFIILFTHGECDIQSARAYAIKFTLNIN